nr:serine hydrolase domain-containing protein [Flavihumibacter sp. UBA7668]
MIKGSIAVSINGKQLTKKAFGASTQTLYRIGSVTKLFTTVLIFKLVEEKRLSLDDILYKFFPDLPNAKKIKIRDLLYHRSGLHDYTKDTQFENWKNQTKTSEELLTIIRSKSPDFEPDSKADYSNSNFLILGWIVEKLSQSTYAYFLKKKITQPLKMNHTYFGSEASGLDTLSSYSYVNGKWKTEPASNLELHGGAGAILSTPEDLLIFMDGLNSGKLIQKSNWNSMQIILEEYGMGVFANKYGTSPGFGHNGRIEEFYSALWYYPKDKLILAVCLNGIYYPRVDLIEEILKSCTGISFAFPFSEDLSLPDSCLGNYSSGNLKLTCAKDSTNMVIQIQGQDILLDPVRRNYFMNKKMGYFFEFFPDKGEIKVKEKDNVYLFRKLTY